MRILDDDLGCRLPGGYARQGSISSGRRPTASTTTRDPEKTQASHAGDYFTLGDIGYFDADGYLFLTGRTADCIISGGVNIYPQEIDNEIIKHPAI